MSKYLQHLSILSKLALLTAVSVLSLVVVSAYLTYDAYVQSRNQRTTVVRSTVETAVSVLQWAQNLETSGQMPREQAQQLAKQAIAKMRYAGNEYLFISNTQTPAVFVMHPIKPELDGKSIPTADGKYLLDNFAQQVRDHGSAVVSYLWPKPGSDVPVEKISYVQSFAPWGWVVGSGMYVDDLHTAFMQQLLGIGLAVVVGVALTAWVAWTISRSINHGLGQAVQVVDAVAKGDLTRTIVPTGKDEVTQLLQAMAHMQSSLSHVVHTVRQGSESVANASAEIAQGNQDLAVRTEQQSVSLEETASSMTQLGSTVRHNADNVQLANQLAHSASSVASEGGRVVGQAVSTMKDINEASRKINDIIQVIDGIAFQTNILALNAAVEAARAGEQGRGFAVVASEVRALAGRSASAAKEIKDLIQSSVEKIEFGTALVDQAGATMIGIVDSIQRVTTIMGEIDVASNDQSQSVSHVGEAVQQLEQATQQNAALVEEMAAAASSLKSQAVQLVEAVSLFKVQSGAGASTKV